MTLAHSLALAVALVPSLTETPESLERALGEIRAAALRADVEFLADDELGGRDTPSAGLRAAALYLAARLERLGFSSAGSGDFFHRYALFESGLDEEASRLELLLPGAEPVRVRFGVDYFLRRSRHALDLDAEGPVVSVGSGTRDEFEAAELRGAWALLFDAGAPPTRSLRYAENGGAIGLLLAETKALPEPYAEKLAGTTRAVRTRGAAPKSRAPQERAELPTLMLSSRARRELLRGTAGAKPDEVLAAGTRLEARVRETRRVHSGAVSVPNVAGFWPGRDPELAHEVLVVSAHFDHLGREADRIYNGADDNASGSAGLLGVAEALAAYGPLRRSVLLLWVSGEEKGLWGSEAWTRDPQLPPGHVAVANLNIDMIGRTEPSELHITPSRDHSAFNVVSRAAYDLSREEGFATPTSQDADWTRSDHYNFDRLLRIPVAFLSSGEHPDYHRATDTAEKIDYAKMARVTRLVVRILDRLEDGPLARAGD